MSSSLATYLVLPSETFDHSILADRAVIDTFKNIMISDTFRPADRSVIDT